MFVFSPAPSNVWADLRVGRVIAFRCGLISGLHHQLEVIGPDKASRDFPACDANFLIDQRKWSIFASGAGSGVSSFLEHLKKEGLRARNLLFQYKICRRTFFSGRTRSNSIPFVQVLKFPEFLVHWRTTRMHSSVILCVLLCSSEIWPWFCYFSVSSPKMRRSRPKHIEGVGRTVVIFLIRVKSCGVVNENILGCTELARMYSEKHVLSRM